MIRYLTYNKAAVGLVALICAVLLAGTTQVCAVSESVTASELAAGEAAGVSFSGGGEGAITLTFARRVFGPGSVGDGYGAGVVVSPSAGNDFDGDYSAVSEVSFRVTPQGDYEPLKVTLYFSIAGNPRKWEYALGGADAAADQITVPLSFSAGWLRSDGDSTSDGWDAWIQQVDTIGIKLNAGNGDGEEVYTLSDFMLDDASGATFIPDRVYAYFGNPSEITEQMKQDDVDTDGDGVKDYLEIWAGTDPNDKNSVFAARIVDVSDDTATIQWPEAAGVTYTVLRSASLTGEFAVLDARVGVDSPLVSVSEGKINYEDGTAKADAAYFYKIVCETE